jgi:hypothetical protein
MLAVNQKYSNPQTGDKLIIVGFYNSNVGFRRFVGNQWRLYSLPQDRFQQMLIDAGLQLES